MEANLKIFMLGARRCGKSSTLASMLSSLNTLNTHIKVDFQNEMTKDYLRSKQAEMRKIFSSGNIKRGCWVDNGESGGSDMSIYSLDVIIHEKLTFHVTCTDIPGEIVKNDMPRLLDVSMDSDVLVFAIDTPQLMENGYGGKLANFVDGFYCLCKILVTERQVRRKRIILVPLKCEKYVHENRMKEVANKVRDVYGELIGLWKGLGKSDCFVVPVQTLGDLEFDHFEHVKKVGDIAYYKYCGNKNYSPRNCEQPLLFAIDYGINKLSWTEKSNTFKLYLSKTVGFINKLFKD